MATYVVVGGGLGGARSVEELRDLDGDARIVLIGGEMLLPYERPPLSKDYLLGEKELVDFTPLPGSWFADHQVEARLGTYAINLDADERVVHTSDGRSVRYDGLVLATGSRPRSVDVPGVSRPGVQTLRNLEDADLLKAALRSTDPLVIYGGGWIGMEVAAVARSLGVPVTVVVREDKILRQLGDVISERFLQTHRDHGVDFALNSTIATIHGSGERGTVEAVTLQDGRRIDAARVLVAVGAEPRLELAHEAGLDIDNGVLVDDSLRTSRPDIVAVGDIANAENAWVGHRVRVEHWAMAQTQPLVAARTLVGDEAHYGGPPFFYTDQYDIGMEFRGVIEDGATYVQRDTDDGYIAFWLRGDAVPRAAINVNAWEGDTLDAILRAGKPIDPEKVKDPGISLEDL